MKQKKTASVAKNRHHNLKKNRLSLNVKLGAISSLSVFLLMSGANASQAEDTSTLDNTNKDVVVEESVTSDNTSVLDSVRPLDSTSESVSSDSSDSALATTNTSTTPKVRNRRALVNDVYTVEDTDTVDTIKAAFGSAGVNTVLFNTDKIINDWDTVSINRGMRIEIADGKNVTFNAKEAHKTSAFNVSLKPGYVFEIINNGTLNLNNYNRGIWVHGGDETSEFRITGDGTENSSLNIENNAGYAIGAVDHYTGKIVFKDTSINVNAAKTNTVSNDLNAESGLYLGNVSGTGDVLLENVKLNIVSPSNAHTSVPFTSNAKNVTIKNSFVESSSRSHYNFEITSSKPGIVQNFTIDNSNIHLITPDDADPGRMRWIFKVDDTSIGVNTYNTRVNLINNSTLYHENKGFNEDKTIGISMSNTEINVDNSTLKIGTLGSQNKYPKIDVVQDKGGLNISNGAKVSITDFNTLRSTDFSHIEITGGSVNMPANGVIATPPNGTTVVNGNGEEIVLFKIPSKNFKNGYTLNITPNTDNPDSTPEYSYVLDPDKLHDDTAYVWAPAVNVSYFPSKADASSDNNQIGKTITTPRGQSIGLVGGKSPQINGKNVSWYNVENDTLFSDDNPILKDTKLYPKYSNDPNVYIPEKPSTPDRNNENDKPSTPDKDNESEKPSNLDGNNESEKPSNPDKDNESEKPSNSNGNNENKKPSNTNNGKTAQNKNSKSKNLDKKLPSTGDASTALPSIGVLLSSLAAFIFRKKED